MAKSDTEETPKKKKSKLKWFILILFILLILGGGAAGAWFFFLAEKFQGKAEGDAAGASGHSETTTAAQQPIGTTIALPEFTVNLADPLGQRFIKISIEVEVSEPKVAQEMDRPAPIASLVRSQYQAARRADLGKLDVAAMFLHATGRKP